MTEKWKDIEEFKGQYSISNTGEVKSLARNVCRFGGLYCADVPEIVMKQFTHYKGYKYVLFSRDGKKIKRYIHRLVACAFIPNPKNLPVVNHDDLNKSHNHVHNLKWATEQENTQHYYDNRPRNETF